MIIKEEVQLDFSDVLIQPQRSDLNSRSEVNLIRTFKFKYSPHVIDCNPIVAANMTGVGTMAMAHALSNFNCLTALHKHYEVEKLIEFFSTDFSKNTFYTLGITSKDVEKFEHVLSRVGYWRLPDEIFGGSKGIKLVCVDVANGYMNNFVEFCKAFRDKHPSIILMAGNVVSGDMTQELVMNGVDIVKVGIGGGCFVAGTQITTNSGYKNIEDIKVGDSVLTHTGRFKKVVNTFIHNHHKQIININDKIRATPNHEFFVYDEHSFDNIMFGFDTRWATPASICEWRKAEELTHHMKLTIKKIIDGMVISTHEKINSINYESINEQTYDFEVEDDHSYIANDIVVHNSVCTTRKQTGVGRPQLSAIIDCANAAHGLNARICSDGGCTVPGDIGKAFCANADFVMLGGMLSGHTESELELENGKYKFFGMSSEEAMTRYAGGVAKHRAAEGKLVYINDRGAVENTVLEILGSVRSTGSYLGAHTLKEYGKRAVFLRVNKQLNEVFGKS